MMQFLSQLVNTGMETHINLMPTVSYTTETAISTMYPKTRNCYDNGEANLTYLPISSGFKYSLNNCIINEMIRQASLLPKIGMTLVIPFGFK